MMEREQLVRRATEYAQRHGLALGQELGSGVHGIVFAAKSQSGTGNLVFESALKVHRREGEYRRERDIYFRLQEHTVTAIRGCHVPRLVRYDHERWVIEMTLVSRPFVLDFAGAYLDYAPDFSEEVLADWQAAKEEQYGSRWPEVQIILGILQTYGIYMEDVKPDNICLES